MSVDVLERPAEAEETDTAEATLNRDGSVRRKPGPKPGSVRKPRSAPAPGKTAAAKTARARVGDVDYRPAILGLAQIPQMILGLVSRLAKKPETRQALQLDGISIALHSPPIADALNTTAKTEQGLARLLDNLMTVGPYGLVIAAAVPAVCQVLANHGVVDANPQMGTYSAEELAEMAGQHLAASR